MITRYDLDGRCDPVEGGSWVDYEDHQREVTQLQARVAELEAALREFVTHAVEKDVGGGDLVLATCESLQAARETLGVKP